MMTTVNEMMLSRMILTLNSRKAIWITLTQDLTSPQRAMINSEEIKKRKEQFNWPAE